jgi:hypothetical protein
MEEGKRLETIANWKPLKELRSIDTLRKKERTLVSDRRRLTSSDGVELIFFVPHSRRVGV